MILRRYGTKILSVTPNFDSRAMTEIGFMRDGAVTLPADEFEQSYARGETHELTAEAKGDVQGDVEDDVLRALREQLAALEAGLGSGDILLIESESGVDYPKTRGKQTTIIERGENRLVFAYAVLPPLRVAVWRKR